MTRIFQDTVTINSINVLPYLYNYNITGTKNVEEITKGTMRLTLDVSEVLEIGNGQEVIIARGITTATEQYILRGHIIKFEEEEGFYLIAVEGRMSKLKRSLVTYSFDKNIDSEGGNPSKIWASIVTGGGLTPSYVDSGTAELLDKFLCNDSYRFERMGMLTKLLGWQQRDDYTNNYIRLEPVGYSSFSTPLVVGSNVINIPFWEEDLEPVRNFIKIKGAYEEDTTVELFSGDSSETLFEVNYEPEITKVSIGGVEKLRGVLNSTASYDYLVDKQLKQFKFTTAPTTGSDNISIEYTYQRPKPVQGKDYTSIELYNMERAEVFDLKDVTTVADAKQRLKQFLKYLAYADVKTELWVNGVVGLDPGMLVEVQDLYKPKYNGNYIANKVTYQYPEPFDLVQIGSTDFDINQLLNTINQRLKLLEQGFEINDDELTSIISLVSTKKHKNRYTKLEKTTANSNNCILDHPVQGFLDSGFVLGDGSTDVYTTLFLMPGNNRFEEYVIDSEFYDSVNSTDVTWTTATNTISIAASGVLLTNAIAVNSASLEYYVKLGTVSGDGLVIEISPDAKTTWETVTLETYTEFSETVSVIYLRITNPTGSPITITTIKDSGNNYITPAIEVDLA